jgi:spore maturation protein CgeB
MTSFNGLTVIFVGDLNPYSNGYSRLKAFRALGARVVEISHTPLGGGDAGHIQPSTVFRTAWKLGFHPDRQNANDRLLQEASREAPALVWIEKGNMIRLAVLKRLKILCPDAIIASYSDDDMYRWSNRTWAYTRGLPYYDVVFTTKSYNAHAEELPRLGARKVIMVDKAYDSDHHTPQDLNDGERTWLATDVGFIGSYERERADDMEYLAQNGIPVRVWGNGWDEYIPREDKLIIERHALVNTPDDALYSKAIGATKINLAFLRKSNRDLQTDRSIEIPACGGFMVAEYSDEHARLFEEDKEAAFFRSPEQLVEKVKYYLANEAERSAIAAAGLQRCRTGGYSHQDRVEFMLGSLFSTL